MKQMLFILLIVSILSSCSKDPANCTGVVITNSAPGCGGWGIVVNGTKYPSENIPDRFKQDGLNVCADYELYQDGRLCVCCGGTWADIKSMRIFLR